MSGNDEHEFLTLHEFVSAARLRLDAFTWDYLIGGTETETTLQRNRAALDAIALRPRVLVDVSKIDATRDQLGRRCRLPVFLAPVGSLASFDPGAGVAVAEGGGAFGVPVHYSSVNTQPFIDIRRATTSPLIHQLYVRGDHAFVDDAVARAIAADFDAFCITVDTAVYSRRERDIAKRFRKPWRSGTEETAHYQAAFSWKDVDRFKARHKIPLILKGIGTAEDARIAVEHGVEVVYVSNHGGRQLDHGRGAIDVLVEVVEAVDGRAKVVVDGGFVRGTDILKAIALGADAVGLGRLYCYALAAGGAPAITRMLEILENEVWSAMGLIGVTALDQLHPAHLHFGAPPVREPGVLSAFPLLGEGDGRYR